MRNVNGKQAMTELSTVNVYVISTSVVPMDEIAAIEVIVTPYL